MDISERNFLLLQNSQKFHEALRRTYTVAIFGARKLFKATGYKGGAVRRASNKLRNSYKNIYIMRLRTGDLHKQQEQLKGILHNRKNSIPTICFVDFTYEFVKSEYSDIDDSKARKAELISEKIIGCLQINSCIIHDLASGIGLRFNRNLISKSGGNKKRQSIEYAQWVMKNREKRAKKPINIAPKNQALHRQSLNSSPGVNKDYKRYIEEPLGSRRDFNRDRASWKRTNS